MSKRVLLTGAGGFMGSHILRHILVSTDWDIVCLDSFRHKGLTDRLNTQMDGQDRNRVTVITHDLKVPISPIMASQIGHIDYIINCASESHVDRSIAEPRAFRENNFSLMETMLEYARKYPVEKFIHISTDEVYGPAPDGYAFKEGDPHFPSNPYSASKSGQESMCDSDWRTYDLPICKTNTMNIIGELQDPEKYVPKIIRAVLNGDELPVHASKDGSKIGSRFYLHARNQADGLVYLLKNIEFPRYSSGKPMAHYHIAGERETNNLELAQMIARFVGKPLKYRLEDFHSSRPGHDLRYALDCSKIYATGWRPPFSFEESLRKTVEWTLRHPEWLEI